MSVERDFLERFEFLERLVHAFVKNHVENKMAALVDSTGICVEKQNLYIEKRLSAVDGYIVELRRLVARPHERLDTLEKRLSEVEGKGLASSMEILRIESAQLCERLEESEKRISELEKVSAEALVKVVVDHLEPLQKRLEAIESTLGMFGGNLFTENQNPTLLRIEAIEKRLSEVGL